MKVSRRKFALRSLTSVVVASQATSGSVAARFVHTRAKDIVTPAGEKLFLRGINLGNWLEPEGYMFLFESGPVSPHEIEAFFEELEAG